MSHMNSTLEPDQTDTIGTTAILAINSLGGPPLPTGVTDLNRIKITLENLASAEFPCWLLNVASLVLRQHR